MTINPPWRINTGQPTAFSVDVYRIIAITVPTITGFGVLLITFGVTWMHKNMYTVEITG